MHHCLPGRQRQLERFTVRLGIPPSPQLNWDLLDLALTHPSSSATANYEQLEFVGDSVLRLFAAKFLWRSDPAGTVGQWTAIRSVLVSDRVLAEIAAAVGLDRFLLVAPSAAHDRKGQASRLADALEAVLGALYLSTDDFSLIQPWLQPEFQRRAERVRADPAYQNYKAALQQWTQAHHQVLPEYRVTEAERTGRNPDALRFSAEVWIQGVCAGVGQGLSRKAAEKAAAKAAYLDLTAPVDV